MVFHCGPVPDDLRTGTGSQTWGWEPLCLGADSPPASVAPAAPAAFWGGVFCTVSAAWWPEPFLPLSSPPPTPSPSPLELSHRWTWSFQLCRSTCRSRCPSEVCWWCWWCLPPGVTIRKRTRFRCFSRSRLCDRINRRHVSKRAEIRMFTFSFRESVSYGLGTKSVWTRARPQNCPW